MHVSKYNLHINQVILSVRVHLIDWQLAFNAGQKGSILQYFIPSLSYQLSLRSFFCLFLSATNTKNFKVKLMCFFQVYPSKEYLQTDNALILDGHPRIYVWIGRECNYITRIKVRQHSPCMGSMRAEHFLYFNNSRI